MSTNRPPRRAPQGPAAVSEQPFDQAAGLRRLFKPDPTRSISINGGRGGTGTTSVVINLAHALARQGVRVLVLDEFSGSGNVSARLGFNSLLDLPTILRRHMPLEDILLDGPDGMLILPLATDTLTLARITQEEQQQLSASFTQIAQLVDIILLDARTPAGPHVPSLSLAASDCLIVVCDRPESITDAYAHIKLMAAHFGRREFRILVNRVDTLEHARAVFNRIRQVARRFMAVKLSLIGYVPQDERLHNANRLLKPVASAHEHCEAALAFGQLAANVQNWPPVQQANYNPSAFVHCLIESSRILAHDLER